jgi:hypothetical protein
MTFPAVPSLNITQTSVKAQPLAIDSHGHTLNVYCQLPRQYSSVPLNSAVHVTITAAVTAGNTTQRKVYDSVPLCINSPMDLPYHLTACTGITPALVSMVPEWVAYHSPQGVQHFTVYVNGNASAVADQLQPLITAGVLTLYCKACRLPLRFGPPLRGTTRGRSRRSKTAASCMHGAAPAGLRCMM